nr:NtaA/DmoA family FMN-dependent monooxygenase [Kineococcus aurantiacus]
MHFYPGGEHATSWRLPGAQPERYLDVDYYADFARTAERGGFATIFLADELYVWDRFASGVEHVVNVRTEPFTLLGALSQLTERIGLAATVSTTYHEPYHVARKLASLDFLSQGRAAWNLVTSAADEEARNFGAGTHLAHADRYRRAGEFVQVVRGLWDSWDDDAFTYDKGSGFFARAEKLHVLGHHGEFFDVRGPLNIARPPQGHPVLFQAGASPAGRALAAANADAVFTPWEHDLGAAQRLYADYAARTSAAGRDPRELLVLPALSPVLGRTPAEAVEKLELIESLTPDRVALDLLSHHLEVDLSDRPLDEPFTHDFSGGTNQVQSLYATVQELVGEGRRTLRDVYRTLLRRRFLPGTPAQVADHMQERFTRGAADGFMLAFSSLPEGIEEFVDTVVPELRRRGVYRGEYRGETLRENLGLDVPSSRWTQVSA